MIEPEHPTEEQILGRIRFHEAGAEWYREKGQAALEAWSKEQAGYWRAKLPTPKPEPTIIHQTPLVNAAPGRAAREWLPYKDAE